MSLRAQPPVHSPLSFAAIAGGLAAAFGLGLGAVPLEHWLLALGCTRVLRTDSGTSALGAALRAASPKLVALPAWSCYDLATAAAAADVPVWLYDLDPATLGPEPRSLAGAVAAGADVVVVAHLYGVPVDMSAVAAAAGPDALIVEDAAQGAGMQVGRHAAGTSGSLGVFSFGRGKGITGGRGGALVANDPRGEQLLEQAGVLVAPGSRGFAEALPLAAQWLLARPSLYGLPSSLPWLGLGDTLYREPSRWQRQSALSAGVLASTLQLADREALRRKRHAERLLAALGAVPGLSAVRGAPGSTPGWLRLPVLFSRDAERAAALRSGRPLGVMPAYPQGLAQLTSFRPRVRNAGEAHPGAAALASRLVTLPTHGQLRAADLEALERWLVASATAA